MNERIKELWENCDEIHTRYPKQGSPINASPELLEKFAELIVRECCDLLETSLPYNPQQKMIKKHFGVE